MLMLNSPQMGKMAWVVYVRLEGLGLKMITLELGTVVSKYVVRDGRNQTSLFQPPPQLRDDDDEHQDQSTHTSPVPHSSPHSQQQPRSASTQVIPTPPLRRPLQISPSSSMPAVQ